MFKIQTLNNISAKGTQYLDSSSYSVKDEQDNPDGILLRSFKMHDMELSSELKAVARAGAGVNNIPIDKCTEKGIVVFNTPGANANSVKELVISALLLSSRKIYQSINWTQDLQGQAEVAKLVEKGKKNFAGPEIMGKKLAVIGLGAIGVMVANAASSLGMDVLGYDPYISVASAWGLSRNVKRAEGLEAAITDVDYISLHIPLVDSTKELINSKLLEKMKDGVRILNFARGELVSDKDILSAIEKKKVAYYVTDFPNENLLGNDGVITVPHLGASTPEAEDNCAVMAVRQIKDYLETGNIVNSVNFPHCEMDFTTDVRITITNRNIPAMVGQITSILAENNINIADMINKHREDIAYTIIDIDGDISPESVDKVRAIDGVISVRVFRK